MSRFRIFDLNPEQIQAIEHDRGPLLILAGAGTGKTRTITARIAWLIAQGEDPAKILAVTFTNKAAREMKERIAGMVDGNRAKLVTASTFHALCLRILRGDAQRLGYKANFSIFDESDQLGLIKKIISRVSARDEKLDPHLAANLISKAKNNAWTETEGETLLGSVFRRYEQELRALNAMDFDDLLAKFSWMNSRIPTACSSNSSLSSPAASLRTSVWWATTTRASMDGAGRRWRTFSSSEPISPIHGSSGSSKTIAARMPYSAPPTGS